ncbi:hypothetical protein NC653_001886 [Populus alba x Populus x berolinensis]|uniref:Uncharacterized protein n=1 Tax=Populus alba x Populus x berolinensis TaxID=444605 RepID=A0AAD6RNI4_9ROSI|nr:hypothetical protein NC653_001886 [Populus alba x Populus x berolinensis]
MMRNLELKSIGQNYMPIVLLLRHCIVQGL